MYNLQSHPMQPGMIQKAPENFLSSGDVRTVVAEARQGRRGFLRGAFSAAAAAVAAGGAVNATAQTNKTSRQPSLEGGDPNILNLPEHSKGLGQGVATQGYGLPSKHEAHVQRRPSTG